MNALLEARQNALYDELLVSAWHKDWRLGWVWAEWLVEFEPDAPLLVRRAGRTPPEIWQDARNRLQHLKHYCIHAIASTRTRPWMHQYLPHANDMLWAKRPDAEVLRAMRAMPLDQYRPNRNHFSVPQECGRPMIIKFRERDRGRDWKTVK